MNSKFKNVKIGLFIVFGLALLILGYLYIGAIDFSYKHQARVNALPLFSPELNSGEFRLRANGMEFLIRVAGMQNDGPAVILLHGFPESSIMWRPLLKAVADKGFRVAAFDQRGYSPGARPGDVSAYQIDSLANDVLGIADALQMDTFHLVGHDWGSVVAWKTTMDFEERIYSLTALAIPHIDVFFKGVVQNPEQQKRSGYMNFLRKPFVPEFLFRIGQKKVFEGLSGIWLPEEIEEYKAIHRERGATTATLNWYRALDFDQITNDNSLAKNINRPTLYIWGKNDPVIAPELINQQAAYIDTTFQIIELNAGHSLMQEDTESIVNRILEHLSN